MTSIRRKCMKSGGLSPEMALPKTCDNQTRSNDKNNKIYNPVNNAAYRALASPTATHEEKQAAIQARIEGLKAVGVTPRPHLYKLK
jgi:hypothetical protein